MDIESGENIRLKREQDSAKQLDEFNAELSGTASGKQYRFLPEDHESHPEVRAKKARSTEAHLSALQALLDNDPAYAAAYKDSENTVRDFEKRMRERLSQIDDKMTDIDEKLEALGPNAIGSTEYKKLREERDALQRRQQDILDYYSETIQPMADRLTNQGRPPSRDDLDAFNDKVRQDMEQIFDPPEAIAAQHDLALTQTINLEIPSL